MESQSETAAVPELAANGEEAHIQSIVAVPVPELAVNAERALPVPVPELVVVPGLVVPELVVPELLVVSRKKHSPVAAPAPELAVNAEQPQSLGHIQNIVAAPVLELAVDAETVAETEPAAHCDFRCDATSTSSKTLASPRHSLLVSW